MKIISKKLLSTFAASAIAFSTIAAVQTSDVSAATKKKPSTPEIKNVIFLIGDGMGTSYTSAYRYLQNSSSTKFVDKSVFDRYLVGQQMTYPEDPAQNVTDSASAATAMSAGVKTYNAAIAVDNDRSNVKTVLEAAKEQGKSTGLVATSEITHATPAAFGAHDETRKNMNGIADDYFDEKIKGKHKIDVLLGGGKANFVRTDRDLTKEFKKAGYHYVTSKDQLQKNTNEKLLGLFADGGLDKKIDRNSSTPSLGNMTNAALKQLSKNKKGFFLMVEGSQIDWAGHDNDIVGAMSEMADFEDAFEAAVEFAKKDKHTLVVATADHSTGGFSVAQGGDYNWNPEVIRSITRTPDFMAEQITDGVAPEKVLKKYIQFPLSEEEIQSVVAVKEKDVTTIDNAIEKIVNQRSNTGWTTGGHTGEDVNVYAYGPGSDQFRGLLDNTDQAKKIFKIIEKGAKKQTVIKDR